MLEELSKINREEKIIKILRFKDGISIKRLSYLLDEKEYFIKRLLSVLVKNKYIFLKGKEDPIIYLTKKGYESNILE